ncbi:MAG: hypothetical protein AAGF33_04915 [Pseudomonadota bacterium]
MTKRTTKLVLGVAIAAMILTACGLRGGLQRPDPIFRDVAPVEQTIEQEVETEENEGPQLNEFGGEIPETTEIDTVIESAIEEAAAGE